MKYGKMVNGAFVEAPSAIQTGDRVIYQPSDKTLAENGYKPVFETPYPENDNTEDMKIYAVRYVEEDSRIVLTWVESKLPECEE